MVRTQVQLPDDLYQAARRLASEHEVTLAEVVRRGLEHMIRIYPPRAETGGGWRPPAPLHLGSFQAPEERWRDLANEGP